jgi:hypothetical protein
MRKSRGLGVRTPPLCFNSTLSGFIATGVHAAIARPWRAKQWLAFPYALLFWAASASFCVRSKPIASARCGRRLWRYVRMGTACVAMLLHTRWLARCGCCCLDAAHHVACVHRGTGIGAPALPPFWGERSGGAPHFLGEQGGVRTLSYSLGGCAATVLPGADDACLLTLLLFIDPKLMAMPVGACEL